MKQTFILPNIHYLGKKNFHPPVYTLLGKKTSTLPYIPYLGKKKNFHPPVYILFKSNQLLSSRIYLI